MLGKLVLRFEGTRETPLEQVKSVSVTKTVALFFRNVVLRKLTLKAGCHCNRANLVLQAVPVRNFNVPTKRPSAPKAAPVTFSSAFLDTTTTPAPLTTPLPIDIMREEINDQLEHNTPNTFMGRVSLSFVTFGGFVGP